MELETSHVMSCRCKLIGIAILLHHVSRHSDSTPSCLEVQPYQLGIPILLHACTLRHAAPEASWGFDPYAPLLFDLYRNLESNGHA